MPDAADKAPAIGTLSALVGGMVLARAPAATAPALSAEVLATLQTRFGVLWATD